MYLTHHSLLETVRAKCDRVVLVCAEGEHEHALAWVPSLDEVYDPSTGETYNESPQPITSLELLHKL